MTEAEIKEQIARFEEILACETSLSAHEARAIEHITCILHDDLLLRGGDQDRLIDYAHDKDDNVVAAIYLDAYEVKALAFLRDDVAGKLLARAVEDLEARRTRFFDESQHPRDERGRWTESGGGGESASSSGFVSPNIGNLDFDQARAGLASRRQAVLRKAAGAIDEALGKDAVAITSVIGAWADGAENSLMLTMPADWTREQARVAMAMKGWLADQKQMLLFSPDPKGDSYVVSFPMPGELGDIHQKLLQDGLAFHTLEPTAEGAIVHAYGEDEATFQTIDRIAEKHDTQGTITYGSGEFIGTHKSDGTDREQRDDARRQYEAVITAAQESAFPGRNVGEAWRDIRDHWGRELSEIKNVADWHTRDKDDFIQDPTTGLLQGRHPGGGTDEPSGAGEAAQDEIGDKEAYDVGGDQWNRETARRLEREYQTALPRMDELANKIVGKASGEIDISTDDEDENAPYIPESWEDMSGDDQESTFEKWKEASFSEFHDSEVNSWHENGDSLDDSKDMLAYKYKKAEDDEWAAEALKEMNKARAADEADTIPYDVADLMNAINIEYETGYSGQKDPEITFDDEKLQQPLNAPPAEQMTLPGIEAPDPSQSLTKEMRDDITATLTKAFNKEAENKASDMEPPEYLKDSVAEYMDEYWSSMDDDNKFEHAKSYDVISSAEHAEPERIELDRLPDKFDPLNFTSGADYKRTQALARKLSVERAAEVIAQRKPGDHSPEARATLANAIRGDVARADKQLWEAWKGSSTSTDGKLLQVATAEELGGRLQSYKGISVNELKLYADKEFAGIGGYEGVKAYVRAKWETTQFMLDKGDHDSLALYRGIKLDREQEPQVDDKMRVTDEFIERNGAASFTTDREVANNWKSGWGDSEKHEDDGRIVKGYDMVIRAQVPRTAIISVPAYGINIHSEHEVVVAGTAWAGWDVFRESAPSVENFPIQHMRFWIAYQTRQWLH